MEKICKWILEEISSLYISIIILIFPLLIGPQGYENILEIKYYSYAFITISYIIAVSLVILYFLIFKKTNYLKSLKLKKYHYILFCYILINILSCIISPYKKYNLFLGLGRGEGLFNVLLYSISLIYITLFMKFKKKYLTYFSLSSIFVSLIALLQFLGLNPLWIFKNNFGPYNMSFMTTIGNKDIISAFYTLTLTISFVSFVFLKNIKIDKIIHLLSLYLGIFIFGIIDVDSGLVAFVISLIIISPFILLKGKYLYKSMLIGAISILGYVSSYIINPVYKYSNRIYHLEPQFNIYALLMLIVALLFIFAYFFIKKNDYIVNKKQNFIKKSYIIILLLVSIGIGTIYFKDFNIPILHDAKEILHGNFDDEIGTYRMFLWKRSIKLVKDYPIIGTGPDTFSYRFMSKYWQDVIKIDNRLTINDTAANVYLTMLINIGIIGLITYLSLMFYILKKLYKKIKDNDLNSLVFLITLVCFLIQDFFNLNVVIITPIFYIFLGLCLMYIDSFQKNDILNI